MKNTPAALREYRALDAAGRREFDPTGRPGAAQVRKLQRYAVVCARLRRVRAGDEYDAPAAQAAQAELDAAQAALDAARTEREAAREALDAAQAALCAARDNPAAQAAQAELDAAQKEREAASRAFWRASEALDAAKAALKEAQPDPRDALGRAQAALYAALEEVRGLPTAPDSGRALKTFREKVRGLPVSVETERDLSQRVYKIKLGEQDADAALKAAKRKHRRLKNWVGAKPLAHIGNCFAGDFSTEEFEYAGRHKGRSGCRYYALVRAFARISRDGKILAAGIGHTDGGERPLAAHILQAGRGYFWGVDSEGVKLVRARDGASFRPDSDDLRAGRAAIAAKWRAREEASVSRCAAEFLSNAFGEKFGLADPKIARFAKKHGVKLAALRNAIAEIGMKWGLSRVEAAVKRAGEAVSEAARWPELSGEAAALNEKASAAEAAKAVEAADAAALNEKAWAAAESAKAVEAAAVMLRNKASELRAQQAQRAAKEAAKEAAAKDEIEREKARKKHAEWLENIQRPRRTDGFR